MCTPYCVLMGECAHSPGVGGWGDLKSLFLSVSTRRLSFTCRRRALREQSDERPLLDPPLLGARSSGYRHRRLPQPGCGAESGRRGRRPRHLHQGVSVSPDLCQAHRRQHGPRRPRAHGVCGKREHGEELGAAQRKVD